MDRARLSKQARTLSELLARHAHEHPDVARCQRELAPLLASAMSPAGVEPIDHVPCARFVTEGGLAAWPDLDRAYSAFYVTALDLGDAPIPE